MKVYLHIFITVLAVLLSFGAALAYEPAVQWQKTFGGNNLDRGFSVQQTSDGGYIIAGDTWFFDAGQFAMYLIRTDSGGNLVWQKTFGTRGREMGYSVQQTTDGGFIITGEGPDLSGYQDVYLVKTDPNGDLLWQRTFGGNKDDRGRSIQQTTDGGYIVAGETRSFGTVLSNVYLIKTDPNGNLLWQKTFGGGDDYGRSVQQTSDGGYIIVGSSMSHAYLIKTDPNGTLLWQKTFGGTWGHSVQQTYDGGYIITGLTYSLGSSSGDVYLVKTDPNGDLLWQKTFGGSKDDMGETVRQTFDGGYIIVGSTGCVPFDWSGGVVYLVKTDPNGNLLWQKTFGRGQGYGYSVQQTSDGGYIITGLTQSFGTGDGDVYLIKLSAEVCQYVLFGDVNSDCKVDFYDFALMAANWLIDCNINPSDPACIPK